MEFYILILIFVKIKFVYFLKKIKEGSNMCSDRLVVFYVEVEEVSIDNFSCVCMKYVRFFF